MDFGYRGCIIRVPRALVDEWTRVLPRRIGTLLRAFCSKDCWSGVKPEAPTLHPLLTLDAYNRTYTAMQREGSVPELDMLILAIEYREALLSPVPHSFSGDVDCHRKWKTENVVVIKLDNGDLHEQLRLVAARAELQ